MAEDNRELKLGFHPYHKIKINPNMLKRIRLALFVLGISILYHSCCSFEKEENLGNNFYLSEYDNVDRRILYSDKQCSVSGVEIVPMTVIEYASNDKWIIAKTIPPRQNNQGLYWIVEKDSETNTNRNNDNTFNTVKPHVFGPLDSLRFAQALSEKGIELVLKKID